MGRGASVRIVTNLRTRLADYLEPIDQDKRMAVDFSTRRAVVTPRVAMAACLVIAVLAVGAIAAVVWPSTPQVEMPAVQDAADAGTTPETPETSAEMPGGPGQETNAQAQAGPLIVSVVGLVVNPGVVEVPVGARVVEAIERAGGLLPEANPASVNLAAPLADGQQIVVGTERSTSTPPLLRSWRNCPGLDPQQRPKSLTFVKRTCLLRASTHLRRFRESARLR